MTIRSKKIIAFMTAAVLTATGCSGAGSELSADDEILIDRIVEEEYDEYIKPIKKVELETIQTSVFDEKATETTAAEQPLPKDEGSVLRILCRNEDIKNAFDYMYGEEDLPDGVSVEFVIDIELSSDYEYAAFLSDTPNIYEENPIDIIVADPDYMQSQINSEWTLPLSEVGFTEADTEDMFGYTVEMGTSSDGVLKAVCWQADPGVFAYRRDIAEAVFGNSSPDYIEELLADYYSLTAELLAQNGYYMIGSSAEAYRLYAQNRTSPWIDENGIINVDGTLKQWADDMYSDVANYYNPNYGLWTSEWCETFYGQNNVFGIYFPVWGTEGVIKNSGAENGTWGICSPQMPYFWGGSFICVSSTTDNPALCGEVLKALTCNSEAMEEYALITGDFFCNSRSAMQRIAENYYSEFFSQNTYAVYLEEAEKISASYITEYDVMLDESYMYGMQDYINGLKSYDVCENDALGDFL
ncbi:MAG: extracellular solute-binding protein [Oscillospiraceae bacterium]|nr:extracellular solute-binding protein [Oscillospiraceae bacterium]